MDLNQGAFDFAEGRSLRRIETPAARRTDPESSHLAADHITKTNARSDRHHAILRAVQENPGLTSRELAKLSGGDRHEFAKRLPELRTAGAVLNPKDENGKRKLTKCSVGGMLAMTWWPA